MMLRLAPRKTLLVGSIATLLVLGGGGLYLTNNPPEVVPVVAGSEVEAGEEAPAELAEGFVALSPDQAKAAGLEIVGVGRGGGAETRLSGRVEPMVDARAAVAAVVGGRVERVLVAPGQTVRIGQPLAIIISGEAATLRADADAAAAQTEAARQGHQRTRSLADQGVVARQEVETSRAHLLSAEAAERAARARSSAAGAPNASGRLSVVSPMNGVVTSVLAGPGGFVAEGGVVAEVTNPARVELVFNAPPTLAASVRSGDEIRVNGPGGDFDAVVTGVAVGAGGENGATLIRAHPTGSVLLPAGAAVSGAIVTNQGAGGLTVPTQAVQTLEGNSVVFVQVRGGFRSHPVLLGRQAGERTEILRGLTGDERIAGTNAFLLKAELAKGDAGHGH